MTAKSDREAFDLVRQRMTENFEQMRKMFPGLSLGSLAEPDQHLSEPHAINDRCALSALSRLMPPGDRHLRCLSIKAREQIQMNARGFRIANPTIERVEHRRQRRGAQRGVGFGN